MDKVAGHTPIVSIRSHRAYGVRILVFAGRNPQLMAADHTFSVGVTGHRPNRLTIPEAAIERRVQNLLAAFQPGLKGRRAIAVSTLAEGADRVFARAALD